MNVTYEYLEELTRGYVMTTAPVVETAEVPALAPWNGPLVTRVATHERELDCIGGMIAWSFSDKKFRHFATHENFCRYVLSIDPSQRTFCERIYHNQGQKLRLDIDSEDCTITAEGVRTIIAAVRDVFNDMFDEYLLPEHVYLCDSSRADKQSYHIIIDGYYVQSYTTARNFAEKVRSALSSGGYTTIAECIDMNIYKTATSLRAAYNYKTRADSVKKIPVGVSAIDTLITYTENCKELAAHCEEKVRAPAVEYENVEKYVERTLAMVPGHRFRGVRSGVLVFDRITTTKCHISGKEHIRDNTLFAVVQGGNLYAKCRHCPGSLLICEVENDVEIHKPAVIEKKVKDPIEIQKSREARISELCSREYQHRKINANSITAYEGRMNAHGDYMNEYPDPPTLYVKAAMGCGKTEALRRHIAKIAPKSVLVVSHRVSFTIDICAKLGYKSYQMVDGEINIKTAPFVVVQCESLHRINSERYEMVICDEVESILAQMFSPTHRRANACWRIFESQIKFTDRLIAMDGNLSQETVDMISAIREDRAELVHNTAIPQIARHKITTSKEATVAILMKLISKGDRVVVPTSSITMAKKLYKMIHAKYPDIPIKMYNSETTAEERETTLRDVNASWHECSVLIYTPTISAGISFTLHHFDSSCDVFTGMQMLRRARHISSGMYYHYVCETGHKLPDTPDALREYVSTSMKHALTYMEDPDGEVLPDGSILFEDTPRFRAWLNIHVRRNHSQTHFLQSLICELKLIGGVVEPLITSFEGNAAIEKMVRGQLRAIGEDIKAEDAEAVASAPELTAEEIEGLGRGIAPKNRAAIAKYYLRRCYNYNGVITPAIARIYGEKSLKLQYHARRNLREVHDEVFARPEDAVKILGRRFCNVMISDLARADGSEVDNLRKLFDFNRDSICVKMLSILGLRLGDVRVITREEILLALSADSVGYKWLRDNCRHICETFGTKVARLPDAKDPNFLKKTLEFINGKLKSRYCISIKLTSKHSTDYCIEDAFVNLFTNTLEIPEPTK